MGLSLEQLEARKGYIGGSDAAAVLGLSRYKTRLGLWSEKTGAVAVQQRETLATEVGVELEDLVATLFMRRTGLQVRRVNEVQVHPKYPFLRAQIDRRLVGVDEILEAKTASAFKLQEWEADDVPPEYIVQVMHQLMVTGAKVGWIACLVGGNVSFVYKKVERDEDMIAELEAKEVQFWHEHVLAKAMPAVSSEDDETLQALFAAKPNEEEPATLSDHFADVVERIKEIGSDTSGELGTLKAELDELRNELKLEMAERTHAVAGRYKITWKEQSSTKLDTARLLLDQPELLATYGVTRTSRVLRTADATKKKGKGG
jgi:putative phage-type endonuclease